MKIDQRLHRRFRGASPLLGGALRVMKMALAASILTGNLTLAAVAWLWMAVVSGRLA